MNNQPAAAGISGFIKTIPLLLLSLLFASCKKTEVDPIPPRVVSTTPSDLAVGVPLETSIRIGFNVPMDSASVFEALRVHTTEGTVKGSFHLMDTLAVFIPENDLQPKTKYTVSLGKGARDRDGLHLAKEFSFQFTTKEADAFTMSKTSDRVTDFERDGSRIMQIGNHMYSFGGWTANPDLSYSDVYRSSGNLSVWEKMPDAPWHGRHVFGCVKMNGKVYVMGGDNLQSEFDVWSTVDGANWTRLASDVMATNVFYGAVAHNNALYVLGGHNSNSVWRSYDGINWTVIASGLSFLNRNIAGSAASFNGRIWIVSGGGDGFGGGTADKDVYSSPDGINWRKEPDFPGMGVQYTDVTVFDNKLWLIGGYNYQVGNLQDIWYMNRNGAWTKYETPADFIGRHATGVGVYNDRLVIACGNYNNDCWVIEKVR